LRKLPNLPHLEEISVQIEPVPSTTPSGTTPPTRSAFSNRFLRLARKFIVPATATKCAGLRVSFDIEANGLHDATKLHCNVITDLDSDRIDQYGPHQIPAALEHLSRARYITGHNITGYDLPTLQRLHNWKPSAGCIIVDTLIASRLILPNLDELDDKAGAMSGSKMGALRGRYSLEAWGMRLDITKAGTNIEDWSEFTPDKLERCITDTKIVKAIWQFLQLDGYPTEALELEHRVAEICNRITADGAPFDVKAAEQRCRQWTDRRTKLGKQLAKQFPGTNLNSRQQLGALLEARGWIPEERTEKTKRPKITDEVLETVPATFPEFTGLAEYDILRRRLAQLSIADEAWCKHVDANGKIHGGLVHIGTPHSRAKHLSPNLAQVPNPKRNKPFAAECRSLFRTSDDWVFVCCDQAGLQDRAFAHYLAEFDNGVYAAAFLAGLDPHWKTATDLELIAKATELDKTNKVHVTIREHCKGFRYGFLFGMGILRAGHIVNNAIRALHTIDADVGDSLQKQFFGNVTRPNEETLKRIGKKVLDKFIAGTPGLRRLRSRLTAHVERFGWLPGLDGRRVPTSAQYKALNFQVTSAEAVITKRWLVRVYDELGQKFRYGWDGDVVIALWVHDEIACCCRPEIADQVGEIMVRHAKEPAEFYGFKVPLDAEYKVGKSWAGDVVPAKEGTVSKPAPKPKAAPAPEPEEIIEDLPWIDVKKLFKSTPPPDKPAQSAGNGYDRSGGYPHGEERKGPRIASYLYRNHLGEPHTKVEKRAATKTKRAQYPQSFFVDGKWTSKKPAGWTKVPYRLPELLEELARTPETDVYLPEGEKDAETLAALGLIATTSSEGATNPKSKKSSNWTPELNKWFTGVKRIFILEDNDEPGRGFAREKARALAGIVPDIRIISFPDVPESEDVTWWLQHGHTKDELIARCESAPLWQGAGGVLESVRAADVKMEAIDWLWSDRFALGKLGILAGLPDEGKSSLLCYIAGRLTNTELQWPNDEGQPPRQGNVILLTSEDSPADTLVPRLVAANAILERVEIVQMVHDRDVKDGREHERMFSLMDDLGLLRQKIEKLGDVVAILIDPVTAYLGAGKNGVDSCRDTDVRAVLGPLVQLAGEHRIAVIAIMHFNKKVDITNALLRISNSLAFGGVARHVFAITKDIANSRRLMTRAKNNVASEENNKTLAFHFETRQVGKDWRDGRPIEAPFIVWEEGYVDVTATEALSAVNANKAPGAVEDAKDFLRDILLVNGGRAPKADIEEAAEAEKISDATLRRAKKALKVKSEKDRTVPEGKWYWALPDDPDNASASAE
jgi:DNA polymerase I-like protein with 3'-5' exonuclease and polymerase domains